MLKHERVQGILSFNIHFRICSINSASSREHVSKDTLAVFGQVFILSKQYNCTTTMTSLYIFMRFSPQKVTNLNKGNGDYKCMRFLNTSTYYPPSPIISFSLHFSLQLCCHFLFLSSMLCLLSFLSLFLITSTCQSHSSSHSSLTFCLSFWYNYQSHFAIYSLLCQSVGVFRVHFIC